MLQTLLAERFGLKLRRETREQQVYALVVGLDGPKLKKTPVDFVVEDTPFEGRIEDRLVLTRIRSVPPGGWQTISRLNGRTVYETKEVEMVEFARPIMSYTDAPIIDMTGLKGYYEVALDVPQMPARLAGRRGALGEASDPSGVSIFVSIQKLGLKLEKRKAPIEHLIVEHIEKSPTEN